MAQFYKTSRPTFVDDFMYKPPYDLYKEVIDKRDKEIDTQVDETNALSKALNFNTLDFDKPAADQKKIYYQSKIEDLTNKIKQDPENYLKYNQDMYNLRKELTSDYTAGDISAMTTDYNKYQAFQKDHAKYKSTDPARYNAGLNTFYNEAKSNREKSGFIPVWDSEQLLPSIDFRKGFVDYVSKMKPNTTAYANSGAKGGFIFKNKGTNESLSEKDVVKLMQDYIASTPNIEEYLRQSSRIGLPEDLSGLQDFAKNYAYSKSTADSSKSRDPLATAQARFEQSKALEGIKQKNRMDLAKFKADLSGDSTTGSSYNGELQTAPLRSILGDSNLANLYSKNNISKNELDPNTPIKFGMPALIGAGIINAKQEEKISKRIQAFSKDLNSFGNKQLTFVPSKEMRTKSKKSDYVQTWNPGKTYILTVKQAKDLGLISNVVENSGQPFYIDDTYNGVRYTFKSPSGELINGNLMPTGSHPNIKEGVQILSNE